MIDTHDKKVGIVIAGLVLGIIALLPIVLCSLVTWFALPHGNIIVFGGVIISLWGIGTLFAIPAVVCGSIGRSRIKKSADTLFGNRLALSSLIIGYINIAILVLIAAIAIPSYSRMSTYVSHELDRGDQEFCRRNLRILDAYAQQYALDHSSMLATNISQLVGAKYLLGTPRCKGGGSYTLPTKLGDKTSCSVHGSLP